MITGSKELIRDINSTNVLETIINFGTISRASIAKHLGLTKATISAIVQDLLDRDLVIEIGSDNTDLGRKPILLSFNKNAGYVICIDIGVDTLSALLSNLQGEKCSLKQMNTPSNEVAILPALISLVDALLKKTKDTPYGLIGITLGIHGVTQNNQVVFAPYYNLNNINLHKLLSEHYNIPVFLENEANLSVIGEKTFMYNYKNMANISVHSGIGLGLIVNDSLYTGFSGHAGEFGHTIVDIDGRKCPCGNKGCLEQYVSERVLLREFATKKGLPNITFTEFSRMFQTGDADAKNIIDEFIRYMSVCVNNVLNSYNPDIVIINSSFLTFYPGLVDKIQNALTSRMNTFHKIVPSALQDSSILLGGICICVKHFLGVKNLNLKNIL